MNLKSLKQQITNIMDYNPPNAQYKNDLEEIINLAYQDVYNMHPWTFKQARAELEILPDLSANLLNGITCAYNDGQRLVTFSASIPVLLHKQYLIEGNYIILQSRAYKIVQILSDFTLTVNEAIRTDGPGTIDEDDQWSIIQAYHYLPDDLANVLSISQPFLQAKGRLFASPIIKEGIPNKFEEQFLRYPFEAQSYARFYIHETPNTVIPGEKISLDFDNSQITNIPSGFYELAWAFMTPTGQIGPLSEPEVIEVPQNDLVINVNFLTHDDKVIASENTDYTSGFTGSLRSYEGLRKVVVYNANFDSTIGRRKGAPTWKFITQTNPERILVAADIAGGVSITQAEQFSKGPRRYVPYKPYHVIRFWPRPNAIVKRYEEVPVNAAPRKQEFWRRLDLRYEKRPLPLTNITDVPDIPNELSSLIVYRALIDIYNKAGVPSMSATYQKQFDELLERARKKFIAHHDVSYVKQSWRISSGPSGLSQPIIFEE